MMRVEVSEDLRRARSSPDGNERAFAEMAEGIVRNIGVLIKELQETESALQYAAVLLRYSQPPVEGKVDIRWWKMRGGDRVREPVLVSWRKAKRGRMAGEIAVPKRIAAPSEEMKKLVNGPVAYAVAVEAANLIVRWKKLSGLLRGISGHHGRILGGMRSAGSLGAHVNLNVLIGLHRRLLEDFALQRREVPQEFEELRSEMQSKIGVGIGNGCAGRCT